MNTISTENVDIGEIWKKIRKTIPKLLTTPGFKKTGGE